MSKCWMVIDQGPAKKTMSMDIVNGFYGFYCTCTTIYLSEKQPTVEVVVGILACPLHSWQQSGFIWFLVNQKTYHPNICLKHKHCVLNTDIVSLWIEPTILTLLVYFLPAWFFTIFFVFSCFYFLWSYIFHQQTSTDSCLWNSQRPKSG